MTEEDLRNLMYTASAEDHGAFVIRYPRGNGVMTEWKTPFKAMKIGTGRRVVNGDDIAFLTFGPVGNTALEAIKTLEQQGVSAALYDMRFVKPIDELMLHEVFGKFKQVITVEDGCIDGGFGSAVIEFMVDHGYQCQVKRLGIPDQFIEHGTPEELFHECGFDAEGMVNVAMEMTAARRKDKMVG